MNEIRNNFMSSFNENISKEENLYNDLVHAFDINNLDNYCNIYRDLIKANMKITPTMNDIKNILSFRKDQLIINAFEKNEIKTKTQAMFYYNDIRTNKWKVSDNTFNNLINLINNFQE